MRNPFLFLLLLAAPALLTFTGCSEDDPLDAAVAEFHFDYLVNGQAFNPNTVYDVNGTAVRFDVANFYVGGIALMTDEGDRVEFTDKYLLVTPDNVHQPVGEVDPGHYHMVTFFIGVDPVTNSQTESDFTNRPADDPLAEQVPRMHWNWNSGYRFLRIDGEVDTDGDGTPDQAMEFHLGRDEYLKTLQFMSHRDFKTGANMLEFTLDLARLFDGIDLATNYSMHTTPDEAGTATIFTDNFANAFGIK